MKKINLRLFITALVAVITISACEKKAPELSVIEVTLATSAAFDGVAIGNIPVEITNTIDNTKKTVLTNQAGVAIFEDIAPSTYNISASKELTAEIAFNYTGFNKAITINANLQNIAVMPLQTIRQTLTLDGKAGGDLVIKEVYSLGAANDGYAIMFKDQFFEIFNNSDETQYLDKLYIAYLSPSKAGQGSTDVPLGLPLTSFVYASKILQFPGTGTQYPLEPGMGAVIAINAINYKELKPLALTVDNSTAQFDTYAITWLQSLGRTGNSFFDVDNPNVPNMNCIYLNIQNNGFFNMDDYASIALVKSGPVFTETIKDPTITTSEVFYMKIPVSEIIDGVDILAKSSSAAFKRLPAVIDSGFTYAQENGSANYTGKSLRRKVAKTLASGRKVLQDSNNSSNDFEVVAPATPRSYNLN
ncbi:MAG: hypothetical protein A2X19_08970 [Bacteroidetes bacterium GWE2_39_28]|nr:MAG: hypothetical protein A2X19_08970 [Bacteroidetes bacterium GWE2_39_28]OFY12160.1 MAG: hypothetical protein A2X16_06325 [Bacteroidetes bacterium GWF2_39_10]OFZ08108.1 MAG: hypothetical protein A2322_07820 [Bacteroidetes bacterium RIFOXYB2_FULL_39_7]OFZ10348.1 MAG: hypothetical protein A2465_02790 [Bacteroidetes bacterium RIFOXYC2_FULL_39_11]HCT94188.1 hypothetical protein [Rikenellaceae bacterium]